MSQMSKNKEIVVRWTDEVLNRGNIDIVGEMFAEDFSWDMPFNPEPLHGPEAMKETVSAFRAAFSDFAVEVEDVLAEGDKVALKYKASGTNDGEIMGGPCYRWVGRMAGDARFHSARRQDRRRRDDPRPDGPDGATRPGAEPRGGVR
jgi:ketosteroid isomerase-like protein